MSHLVGQPHRSYFPPKELSGFGDNNKILKINKPENRSLKAQYAFLRLYTIILPPISPPPIRPTDLDRLILRTNQ